MKSLLARWISDKKLDEATMGWFDGDSSSDEDDKKATKNQSSMLSSAAGKDEEDPLDAYMKSKLTDIAS